MSVELTETAGVEVRRLMEKMELPSETHGLRVGVAGGGCGGFQYRLTFQVLEEIDPEIDQVYESHGIKVAVDKKSGLYLDGTKVDYHDGLEKKGFVFDNPQSKKCCGCGSSFSCG